MDDEAVIEVSVRSEPRDAVRRQPRRFRVNQGHDLHHGTSRRRAGLCRIRLDREQYRS